MKFIVFNEDSSTCIILRTDIALHICIMWIMTDFTKIIWISVQCNVFLVNLLIEEHGTDVYLRI